MCERRKSSQGSSRCSMMRAFPMRRRSSRNQSTPWALKGSGLNNYDGKVNRVLEGLELRLDSEIMSR